jgi:hypothetical protein
MPRGVASPIGTETVNANGYTQVKVGNGQWVGKHVVILEKRLGRKLRPGERAIFKDGDKTNFADENIELAEAQNARSIEAKIAKLQAEIEDRQALIQELKAQRENLSSVVS